MTATLDPVAVSVAAYATDPGGYALRNAAKMAVEVARFAALVPAGGRVLDVGCGPGRDLARFRAAGLAPLGVDLSPAFAAMASTHAPVVVADVRALPLADRCVDGVWACASLVHLDHAGTAAALVELRRGARAGSPMFVAVKSGPSGWRCCELGWRWFRGWTVGALAAAAARAGWRRIAATAGPEWVDLWVVAR